MHCVEVKKIFSQILKDKTQQNKTKQKTITKVYYLNKTLEESGKNKNELS